MPAEWRLHAATWITWPHNRDTWPGAFEPVEPIMDRAVRALAESETVHVNARSPEAAVLLEKRFADAANVIVHVIPNNDAWIRDHGATFVTRTGLRDGAADPAPDGTSNGPSDVPPVAAVNWRYNAWGGKYPPWDLDEQVATKMAATLGVPVFDSPLYCEGGALETDGAGLVMTTASCLLNANRNPSWTRREVEAHLGAMIGATEFLWLPGTELAGDDTDGHIDNLARFTPTGHTLVACCNDRDDPNAAVTQLNLDYLRAWRSHAGRALDVVELELPRPLFHEDSRLPASYANYYVANEVILLPVYGQKDRDQQAIDVVGAHHPGRHVVPIDCTDLVWGLGAFHCLTQQVPAGR